MDRLVKTAGTKATLGLGALALAVVALPAAGALASPQDPTAALAAEQGDKGRQLFADNGCNACQALADAKAAGSNGPALDGNGKRDEAYIVNIVTNGQGVMPSYGW